MTCSFLKNLCRWNSHSGCSALSRTVTRLVYLQSNATPDLWNSLPIVLRLSLVLVLNLPGRSLLHAEDPAPTVLADVGQLVPALEWSAVTVASAAA
ncbi:hypothetical protein F2Q68_00003669 [Brassica cretica]|uniref:Uncharacterized protein n=1 Tax=Brassica cretica TaxID=69181 RepID=A0A8S9JLG2_BRACR|nr:hypothetical protein F2Q68_00003669 [Brassica cretica]